MTRGVRAKKDMVRLIVTSIPPDALKGDHRDDESVYMVIGPIPNFTGYPDLQEAIEFVVRGFNLKPAS